MVNVTMMGPQDKNKAMGSSTMMALRRETNTGESEGEEPLQICIGRKLGQGAGLERNQGLGGSYSVFWFRKQ